MELNEFALSAAPRNHKMCQVRKFQAMENLLKDHDTNMDHIVSSKDQEFIDHTLLAPEYIRESNNFIMDLIDHQVVFPKPTGHGDPMSNGPNGFVGKDQALITEEQFQNAMFQFVNKHGQISCSSNDNAGIVDTNVNNSLHFDKVQPNFMSLNDNYINSGDTVTNKPFCSPSDETIVHTEYDHLRSTSLANAICDLSSTNKETMDHCGIISDVTMDLPPGSLISDQELICSRLNAKKVLPHKKRISKKLKAHDNNYGYDAPVEDCLSKDLENRLQEHNALQFSCEICGHATSSQLNFFAHLKLHYEPPPPDPMLPAMKDSLSDLEPNNRDESDKEMVNHVNVQQVFTDVHINFEDFQPSDVSGQLVQPNRNDDMKILNSNSIDKCIQYVTQSEVNTQPKHVISEEIEFSDTEDMLEGIRNVVDKVSIEDTCDALDMVTSPCIRSPWLTLNNFNCISSKTKLFESSNFAAPVNNDDLSIPKIISTNLNNPQNENDISIVNEKLTSCLNSPNDCSETEIYRLSEIRAGDNVNMPSDSDGNQVKYDEVEVTEMKLEIVEKDDDDDDGEGDVLNNDDDKFNKKRKLYPCTKCSREFNSKNALKYHLRIHAGIRAHQCDVCGKSFFAQGALKSHIRIHTDVKPYKCEFCDKYFRQTGDVKYHMASIHNAEKNYQCEFCGKAFARQYSLALHRRIHTNERNYKCEYCPMSFRASNYLQNHIKIHTGEKPHQCSVCSKKFRVSGDLRRHLKIHQRKNNKAES